MELLLNYLRASDLQAYQAIVEHDRKEWDPFPMKYLNEYCYRSPSTTSIRCKRMIQLGLIQQVKRGMLTPVYPVLKVEYRDAYYYLNDVKFPW
ncbi:hypothetical protein [Brevibacillus choshinensis]|uniref:hypothetical protein n=1 Tax=Brevibacillus choshinensis TaxID=54911 RepID=UPI002E1B565F|nr:hypothetical protein [Brevibacillus choshinensis]